MKSKSQNLSDTALAELEDLRSVVGVSDMTILLLKESKPSAVFSIKLLKRETRYNVFWLSIGIGLIWMGAARHPEFVHHYLLITLGVIFTLNITWKLWLNRRALNLVMKIIEKHDLV